MAIATQSVIRAVVDEIASVFPDRKCETDFAPQEFKRPCFYVGALEKTVQKLNHDYISVTLPITIVVFEEVNTYVRAPSLKIYEICDKLIHIFDKGYIRVGNRALKLNGEITVEYEQDICFLNIVFEYSDVWYDNTGANDKTLNTIQINTQEGVQ